MAIAAPTIAVRIASSILLLAALGSCSGTASKAEDAVRRLLIDPESAQFRDVKSYPNGDGSRVCGEVNAKNRLGGYVGFSRFVVDMRGPTVRIDPGGASLTLNSAQAVRAWSDGQEFDRRFSAMCSNAGTAFVDKLLGPDAAQ